MSRHQTRSHEVKPNYTASCPGIADWSFFARDHETAVAMTATFTRWSLEHAGKVGKFDATLTEIKGGTTETVAVKVGAQPVAEAA